MNCMHKILGKDTWKFCDKLHVRPPLGVRRLVTSLHGKYAENYNNVNNNRVSKTLINSQA